MAFLVSVTCTFHHRLLPHHSCGAFLAFRWGKQHRALLFSELTLANCTITGKGENTSLMQSTQYFSTSPRSRHSFFLSVRASCFQSVPWFWWNKRNLLLLISKRLVNTARILASSVPSSRLLHSAIYVSIPTSQGLVNAFLAFSCSCCLFCTCIRSSLFSLACYSICSRVDGSGSSGSITRRFICDSLATPKSMRNRRRPARRFSRWAVVAVF